MKLPCDLCGHILTQIDDNHAICDNCGIEYGPDRLQELRAAMPTPAPVSPAAEMPPADPEPKQKKKKSGCFIWFLIIMGVLDLAIGTHGIVAVFCLIIILIAALCSKKK